MILFQLKKTCLCMADYHDGYSYFYYSETELEHKKQTGMKSCLRPKDINKYLNIAKLKNKIIKLDKIKLYDEFRVTSAQNNLV